MKNKIGTKENPTLLKTPPLTSEYTMHFDVKDGKEILRAPEKAVYDPSRPGTLTADNPLVKLMEGFGWQWGGNWTKASNRIDYMHFEKIG